MVILNENKKIQLLSVKDLKDFAEWFETPDGEEHIDKEEVKTFLETTVPKLSKFKDDKKISVAAVFDKKGVLQDIYNNYYRTGPGFIEPIQIFASFEYVPEKLGQEEEEKLLRRERESRIATFQEFGDVLKEVLEQPVDKPEKPDKIDKPGPQEPEASGGGTKLELVSSACDSPWISGFSGGFVGFLPRYLYHRYSRSTVPAQQAERLRQLGVGEFAPNRRERALQHAAKFKDFLSDLAGKLPKGSAPFLVGSGIMAALTTATGYLYLNQDVASDASSTAKKLVTKPYSEFKKFFELIDPFVAWGNKIDNTWESFKGGEYLHYVLDPCFAGAMIMGFTSLSLVNVATGRAGRAKRYEDFFTRINNKNIPLGSRGATDPFSIGSNNQFLKEIAGMDGGAKFIADIAQAEKEMLAAVDGILDEMAKLPGLGGPDYEKAKRFLIERLTAPDATGPVAGRAADDFYKSIGQDSLEGAPLDFKAPIENAISRGRRALNTYRSRSQEITGEFMKTMKGNVLSQLASEVQFFRVFDLVPGVIPDGVAVGYFKKVVKEMGKKFTKDLKTLKSYRIVLDNLITKMKPKPTPDFLDDLAQLERHLDEITMVQKLAAVNPDRAYRPINKIENAVDAFRQMTDPKMIKFYDGLDPKMQKALGDLYMKKRDLLSQIDVYEAWSRNTLEMTQGTRGFNRFIGDENDYVNRLFDAAEEARVFRQGPDVLYLRLLLKPRLSRMVRIAGDYAGAALFTATGLVTLLNNYVEELNPVRGKLKRETINDIHNFLDAPFDETEARKRITATQRAIAGYYEWLASAAERSPNLTYQDLLRLGSKKALENNVKIDLSAFGPNLKPVEKMIMYILVLEYIKNPDSQDPMHPNHVNYQDTKITDRADPKRLVAAANIMKQTVPILNNQDINNLFEGSYYIIRNKFRAYGELKIKSEKEKISSSSISPDKKKSNETGEADDKKPKETGAVNDKKPKGKVSEEWKKSVSKFKADNPGIKDRYSIREIYNITKNARPSWANEEDIINLTAITIGESEGIPFAKADKDGGSTGDPMPKDNSYGLWQINMIGTLGPDRRKKYKLKSNEDLYDPNIAVKVAWGIYKQAKGGKNGKKNGMKPWAASVKPEYQEDKKRVRAMVRGKKALRRLQPKTKPKTKTKKEYKLNDLRNLVTEVMNEERVTQTSIGNTAIDKLNRRLKNDPHAMVDIAYGGNIPDRSLEDKVAHHEQSVVKANESEFYMAALNREERDPDGKKDYYRQIIDAAGDDAYIVVHEKLYGSGISTIQPAIFSKPTAESFYDFLEYWPEDKHGKIRLNAKTATYDAVKGASTRWKKMTSQHLHGHAVDLNVPFEKGTKEHLDFKNDALTIAMGVGFNSFGFGPNVLHMDTRGDNVWWIYHKDFKKANKFKFGKKELQKIVPIQSSAFRELVYGPSIPVDRVTPLDRAVAQLTGKRIGKRRVREMKKNDLDKLIAEFLNENTGQGYGQYPYHSESYDEEEPAEDYMEEWKSLELDVVRDETRNTAIAVAKILVKDLELFNDVLDLAGQNQSLGTEILRKLKETKLET